MTITLPPTFTAAQSNRVIMDWKFQLQTAGPAETAEITQACEAMHLRSVNQVRATRNLPPVTTCGSVFATPPVLVTKKSGKDFLVSPPDFSQPYPNPINQKGLPVVPATDRGVWSTDGECDFCGKIGTVRYLGMKGKLKIYTCGCVNTLVTEAESDHNSRSRIDSPDGDPLHYLMGCLEACADRSSPEARKIRKQIRALKDQLGIAR